MHLPRGTCRHSPVPIDPIELRPEPTGWCSAVAFPSRERARALRALLRFALCLSVSHLPLAHMRHVIYQNNGVTSLGFLYCTVSSLQIESIIHASFTVEFKGPERCGFASARLSSSLWRRMFSS